MRPLDIIAIFLACLCWAGNFAVGSWALGIHNSQPFALAAIRAAMVVLLMGIFLFRPRPKKFGQLLIVCLFIGPVHLALLYTGLQTAPASGSAIVSQMLIPFATILSVIFLRERIGGIRLLAIVGAFAGTMIMLYDPAGLSLNFGLFCIVMAYLSAAIASVLIKRVGEIDWRVYVAWTALMVLPIMSLASVLTERADWATMIETSLGPTVIAAGYAAILVSILAHGQYFRLLGRYDVSLIVPLTLMTPLLGAVIGVSILGEPISAQLIYGAIIILPCVALIMIREAQVRRKKGASYGQIAK